MLAHDTRKAQIIVSVQIFISLPNVKVMAHPLAGANVDRGVEVGNQV
jgi:hypothetical protein